MKVDNKISGDGKLAAELNFKHIDDFEPARVAEQVGPLRELLEMRQRLTQLMSKMEGNDKLEELLGQVLNNTDAARKLAEQMGIRHAEGESKPAGIRSPDEFDRRHPLPAATCRRSETCFVKYTLHFNQVFVDMSSAEQAASRAAGEVETLDFSIRSSPPPGRNRTKKRPGQRLFPAIPQPGGQAGPGYLQGCRSQRQALDRPDRQGATAQVNEIMHQPEFQKLESTWRGLHYLVHHAETGENLKVRVLNVSKRDLFKDLEKAAEFDQSALFKKIYEEEYGQLGGQPYGMLVGDYEFGRVAGRHQPAEDDLERRGGGPCPVRRGCRPEDVQLRQLHGIGQSARSGQDFRQRRICLVEVVPRIGRFAVRRPDAAAHAGPLALRRRVQAGRGIQLRGIGRRQGSRQAICG